MPINQQKDKTRIALIGANGMLAGMVRHLAPSSWTILAHDLPEFDLTDREQVLRVLEEQQPGIILNCAAFTDVDGCETREELATRVNGHGPRHLAEAARQNGALLVHISTDYVFDGTGDRPYTEEDAPNPRSAYGRSKLLGEEAILRSGLERFFIVRTSWLYGPGGRNFVETIARLAGEREELRVVADQIGSPTYTEDLAQAIFRLLALDAFDRSLLTRHGHHGIYHFADEGECSWHDFAREIVNRLAESGKQLKTRRVLPITTEEYPLPAPRPAYSVLSKEKYHQVTGADIPKWETSLVHYLASRSPLIKG